MKKINGLTAILCFIAGMWTYKYCIEKDPFWFFFWMFLGICDIIIIMQNTKDE